MVSEVNRKLDSKADSAAVSKLEERVTKLEATAASKEAVEKYRQWVVPFGFFSVCSVIGAIVALVNTF